MLSRVLQNDLPVLIAGPTASGKSALGIEIAREFQGCIINADALQVYADWQILTARPIGDELAACPHFMYGHVGLAQDYSVGHWLREVSDQIAHARSNGLRPIILGGTGLYFMALTMGLTNIPDIPAEIRTEANALGAKYGLGIFADQLREGDPLTYSKIDILNPARTQRAWEVLRATGKGLAQWQDETPPPLLPLDQTVPLNLVSDKEWLNDRIDRRFDMMVDMGALDECRAVMNNGWDETLPSCQAIGAKELIAHINGDMDLDAAIELAKVQTRQYAKRQRTWFRSKMKNWQQVRRVDGKWEIS
ncbi:tRNA (adenosine(37)-N6)-dimethylallyltransferase MiaA [Amylibacter kogurei]|uniref:tRNA dimethylallyltransferase n=1 Tax=Paramylibacter kogurei TaxID=1889778 RepID=A0A2G5K522_9RHOB|nr:tRNA (adenosine(37)-N6)-dimethylallyltransferase MiaA [Amylibacter kogurei]PIB24647.1 tRNA (adenosine(37)-N6)-dimethylallyltransferase MiaA [Amylibacter kogurei]